MPLEEYQGVRSYNDLTLPLELKVYEGVKLNLIESAFYLLEFDMKRRKASRSLTARPWPTSRTILPSGS
jgi:hypothetical protein